jgi:hypothetical protein
LRVSPKREKPIPRVVFRSGSQNSQVAEFLTYRTVVKSIIGRMQENEKTETPTERNKPYLLTTQETKPKNNQQHVYKHGEKNTALLQNHIAKTANMKL